VVAALIAASNCKFGLAGKYKSKIQKDEG